MFEQTSKPAYMSEQHLQKWLMRLSEQELPAFAHTARSLAYVSRNEDSSANDLSNVILHDSAMTARILRIANSFHYNPTGGAIETVSYAIVVLGFEQVRSLALTISMIDTVLGADAQSEVKREMVCAYHAAIQAQRLAKVTQPENLEATYIGALLHRLGPIMFWCFPFGKGKALLQAYKNYPDTKLAERKTLGFDLDSLTNLLVSEWNLSAMLESALQAECPDVRENSAVQIGRAISNNLTNGWDSAEMGKQINLAAEFLDVELIAAREHVYSSARIASEGLESFGFPATKGLMPPTDEKPTVAPPVVDSFELELRILRQLTQMLAQNLDLNQVLMAVLEGIYRVLKMDQVVFALIDKRSNQLCVKHMLGKRRAVVMNPTSNAYGLSEFSKKILEQGKPTWCNQENTRHFETSKNDSLIKLLAADEYLISPVQLNTRVIGLVYADRYKDQTPFVDANLQSFSHLCSHASLAFTILSQNKK
ncbi:MAG: HDOD domain-containing protein [Pseudomonadales bacterium]|nr:HDOD domain-containing protein [Pseudomonadales bacterium]